MGNVINYKHHGNMVAVDEDLKGLHREHCLCHRCKRLKIPRGRWAWLIRWFINCPRANILYTFCVLFKMTTPVFECPIDAFDEMD